MNETAIRYLWHSLTNPGLYTLWPLLILCSFSMTARASLPLAWSKWLVGQIVLILCVVLMGIFMKNLLVAQIGGWFLFVLFHAPGWYAFRQVNAALNRMDPAALSTWADRMPYIVWGKPGEFWQGVLKSFTLYTEGRVQEADQILAPWKNLDYLPVSVRQIPIHYAVIGRSVAWDWQGVVDEFERLRFDARKADRTLYFSAARAYLELGQLDKAFECMRQTVIDEQIMPMQSLALGFLPFFMLCGDVEHFDLVSNVLKRSQKDYSEALINGWRGRCLYKAGQVAQAVKVLQSTLDQTKVEALRKRVSWALEQAQNNTDLHTGNFAFSLKEGLEKSQQVFDIFQRAAYIQEILEPRRESLIVRGLVMANIAVFLLSNTMFPLLGYDVAYHLTNGGMLDVSALHHGQYYRFITFQFLHSSIWHLFFNLAGLYFVGRLGENLFGSLRFIAIYLVGGLLSGVFHILSDPATPVIGASGSILAIFAAASAGIYRLKDFLPQKVRRRYLSVMAAMVCVQLVLDQLLPRVAVFAHLGGLIFGLCLGGLVAIRSPERRLSDSQKVEVEGLQTFVD